MGVMWSRRLEEEVMVPSGSSNSAGNGQGAARSAVPRTSAGSGTEKKQGESSSSSSPPPPPPPPPPPSPPLPPPIHKFSDIVAKELEKDGVSAEKLRAQVSEGIYLDEKKKKYWVDKSTGANCFMLFAGGLSITWGSDIRYWNWIELPEEEMRPYTEDPDIDVAYLKDVCWLEIRGSLDMSHLTPGFTYDVFFVAKLHEGAYGWSVPVELQLKFPGGSGTKKENIWRMYNKKEWSELKVGEVVVPAGDGQQGNVDVAMLRLGGDWKRGLILLGIQIKPQTQQ